VGAAFEGALRGLPAIAVSVDTGQPAHLDEAVELLHAILGRALTRPLAPRTVLNITLPDLPRAEIKGVRAAALGGASCHDRLLVQDGGRSGEYHIVCERPEHAPWPASDFEAVAGGYIALTPLRYDLVDESALAELDDWGRDV
jgi:5'-nucleotidase